MLGLHSRPRHVDPRPARGGAHAGARHHRPRSAMGEEVRREPPRPRDPNARRHRPLPPTDPALLTDPDPRVLPEPPPLAGGSPARRRVNARFCDGFRWRRTARTWSRARTSEGRCTSPSRSRRWSISPPRRMGRRRRPSPPRQPRQPPPPPRRPPRNDRVDERRRRNEPRRLKPLTLDIVAVRVRQVAVSPPPAASSSSSSSSSPGNAVPASTASSTSRR